MHALNPPPPTSMNCLTLCAMECEDHGVEVCFGRQQTGVGGEEARPLVTAAVEKRPRHLSIPEWHSIGVEEDHLIAEGGHGRSDQKGTFLKSYCPLYGQIKSFGLSVCRAGRKPLPTVISHTLCLSGCERKKCTYPMKKSFNLM